MTNTSPFADAHDELRAVAAEVLGRGGDLWKGAVDAGWLGLEVPEALGGAGATFAETAVVLEQIGRATAAGPFLGTITGVGAALAASASDARDELLAGVASGDVRLAVATAPRSDSLRARAPFSLAGGVLSGRAELVLDAPTADRLILGAVTPDGGVVLVVLPADRLQVTEREVLDATRSVGTVEADAVAVDSDSVWTLPGDGTAALQRIHDRAATAVTIDAIGVAAGALERTVAYVGERHQFDRPIGSFQAVKHRCADMAVSLRVSHELLSSAVEAMALDESAELSVSRAKSYGTAAAVDVVGGAMQLHGGIGYTWESGIHVALKRTTFDRALYGSPAAHRRRIAERFR